MKPMKWISMLFLLINSHFLIAQTPKDTLIVGYTEVPPFIISEGKSLGGINVWLWRNVAKDLNLEYRMVLMDFRDMLSGLEAGTVDVCINPLTITSGRNKKMDFTHPFYASNSTVVIKEISSIKKITQFLKSFFNKNFLSGFLILVFVICAFGTTTWYFERKKNPEQFRPGWKGLWDGMWWSVVTMTTVGYGDKSPKSRGGKMVALVWMFSGLLFISGFTASVASSLTINYLGSNIEAIDDFKKRRVGTISKTSTAAYLNRHFFQKIILYDSLAEGLFALDKGEVEAFLYDEPILKYRLMNDFLHQHLEVLPITFDLQFYAFGLAKKHRDLNDEISQKVLEYVESLNWRVILGEYNLSEI